MKTQDFLTIYLATIGAFGSLAAFVVQHLLSEIKRLHARVDDVINILLER